MCINERIDYVYYVCRHIKHIIGYVHCAWHIIAHIAHNPVMCPIMCPIMCIMRGSKYIGKAVFKNQGCTYT